MDLVLMEKPALADVYHHGVKGMKWGVRNGPPYPVDDDGHTVRKKIKGSFVTVATNVKGKTAAGVEQAEKSNAVGNKSHGGVFTAEHYYDKYKAVGYSDEDAEQLARNAALTNKVILGLGVAVGTAALAYAGYRIYDTYADKTIKANGLLQTVHTGDLSTRVKGPFYATYLKSDNTTYSSAMFGHLSADSKISKLAASRDIKIASESSARQALRELLDEDPLITWNDPRRSNGTNKVRFSDYCKYIYGGQDPRGMSRREFKNFYERFNYELVKVGVDRAGIDRTAVNKRFYDKLASKGYSAVVDTNDAKNDMRSFRPLIVFGEPVRAIGSRSATDEDLHGGAKLAKAMTYRAIRSKLLDGASANDVMNLAVGGSMATAIVGVRSYDLRSRKQFIDSYREEHPNTKMTNAELKQLYDKQYEVYA